MTFATTFDGDALIAALDERRAAHELDWQRLADTLYAQSAELNEEIGGHAMCGGALMRTARRKTMTCQYALTLLRWLGRPPEDFLTGPSAVTGPVAGTRLPDAGADRRLRFDLPLLHAELNDQRQQRGLTWRQLADELGCTPARLTNLRTARLADMDLTMRITQWLRRPAARFVHATDW